VTHNKQERLQQQLQQKVKLHGQQVTNTRGIKTKYAHLMAAPQLPKGPLSARQTKNMHGNAQLCSFELDN